MALSSERMGFRLCKSDARCQNPERKNTPVRSGSTLHAGATAVAPGVKETGHTGTAGAGVPRMMNYTNINMERQMGEVATMSTKIQYTSPDPHPFPEDAPLCELEIFDPIGGLIPFRHNVSWVTSEIGQIQLLPESEFVQKYGELIMKYGGG